MRPTLMAGGNPGYRGDEAGGGGNPWGIPNRPSKLVTEGLGLPPEAGYLLDSIPNLDVPDLHGDEAQVVSSLINLAWIVGDFKGIVEALTGEDLITGRQLSKLDRALNLLPALARSGKLFTLAPEAKAGLVTAADAVGAASAEIRASEVARQAALKANDVEALQISTLEKLEALDRAEEHALWWTDFAARSADRAELTTLNTELAQAATLEALKRLDRVEAALRFAGETNDPIAYLAALPQAADQVSDLGQFLETWRRSRREWPIPTVTNGPTSRCRWRSPERSTPTVTEFRTCRPCRARSAIPPQKTN